MRVRRTPPWLPTLIDDLCSPGSQVLWVGPELTLQTQSHVHGIGASDPVPDEGLYSGVFVASLAAPNLIARLRSLRPLCAPGAVVCLLLPESRDELGARVRQFFDPLGNAHREPRPLSEQCGALLSMGASGIAIRRHADRLRCVTASLPAQALELDAAFAATS